MALPPIVTGTIQSAVLGGTSNIIAQALTSYRNDTPFVFNWVPFFQFVMYGIINTPPNFLWQEFLEQSFPGYLITPTKEAITSASANDEKALDKEARDGTLVEPRLNIRNTLIKFALDQTIGAAINTFLFSIFMNSIQAAMLPHPDYAAAQNSAAFLLSKGSIDYSRVDWHDVIAKSRETFVPIVLAGWRLWPFVSLVNFVFVKSVQGRNLVGSLAGVAWGIYMSLFAAQ